MNDQGRWLRSLAARVFARQTMERVIDPVLADIQTEHEESHRKGDRWRTIAVWVDGYVAFWAAITLHVLHAAPASLRKRLCADDSALGRMIAFSAGLSGAVTLFLVGRPFAVHSQAEWGLSLPLFLLPQAIPLGLTIAVPAGIVWTAPGNQTTARAFRNVMVIGVGAALLSFVAVQAAPFANRSFRTAVADRLEQHGITGHSVPRGPSELSLSELAMRAGHIAALQDRHADAIEFFRREIDFLSKSDHPLKSRILVELNARLGASYQRVGDAHKALSMFTVALESFDRRVRLGADDPFTRYYAAGVHAMRGDSEPALAFLERALSQQRAFTAARARIEPEFDSLRSDPRFQKLVDISPAPQTPRRSLASNA